MPEPVSRGPDKAPGLGCRSISRIMGDSRARCDGETLVVDVVHFGDQNWLDRSGNYHSADMHLVERWTRTGPNHLSDDATIEDPRVFSRP